MTPEIIAHRGASYLAPENTLAAFRKAMEIGADGVEMDVQQTSDKKLVIHHDYIIDMHTDIAGKIYDMTEGELKELDFGSWKDVSFKDERIATLHEALSLCKGMEGTLVQLEMKATIDDDPEFVSRVVEEIRAQDIADRLVLISFNHDLLRQAKRLMPELKVGTLVYGAVESMALPKGTWEFLGMQNSIEETNDFPQLPELSVENVDDENCSWMIRWVSNQVSMLRANFPGKSLAEVLQRLAEQHDPVEYIKTLDFKPDWVSCEYHTAYQQPGIVQKLHDLGIKAAFWTVDTEEAVKDLWPLQPDAIVTNRPDRVREWTSELEMEE